MTGRAIQRLEALERRSGRRDRPMAHEEALALLEREPLPADSGATDAEVDEEFVCLTGRSRPPGAAP